MYISTHVQIYIMTLLKKLFQLINAYYWLSLIGITIIALVYIIIKKENTRNEIVRLKYEEKKNIWSSRSLLFESFADLALLHLVTTRPPEHTLPVGYIEQKLKEIRQEGVLRLGGDEDPLVVHRKLMLTLRQWRMTRQAWKHLPGLTGYIYNPEPPSNRTMIPVPFRPRQEVLDEIAEYNEHHTQEPTLELDEDKSSTSETGLSDYSYASDYQRKYFNQIKNDMYNEQNYFDSKTNISSYEKISAYSSPSAKEESIGTDEFRFYDTFEYMDKIYRNLSKAAPQDFKFQILQKALKFKSENASSRQMILDKQHMNYLLNYLRENQNNLRQLRNYTEGIDAKEAFHMLKLNLKTSNSSNKNLNINDTLYKSLYLNETENFENKYGMSNKSEVYFNVGEKNFSRQNFTIHKNDYNITVYHEEIKKPTEDFKNHKKQEKSVLFDPNKAFEINETFLKKLQQMRELSHRQNNTEQHSQSETSNNNYYSKILFTKQKFTRRGGILIRPYTRKPYTIRHYRTYACVRSLKVFRTYTAKISRRKPRWFSRKTIKKSFKYHSSERTFWDNNHKINNIYSEINKEFKNSKLHNLKRITAKYLYHTVKRKLSIRSNDLWYNYKKNHGSNNGIKNYRHTSLSTKLIFNEFEERLRMKMRKQFFQSSEPTYSYRNEHKKIIKDKLKTKYLNHNTKVNLLIKSEINNDLKVEKLIKTKFKRKDQSHFVKLHTGIRLSNEVKKYKTMKRKRKIM